LALLMPLLALLMLGALDLGRAFIAYTRLTNVVREGALYGGHFPDQTAAIRARAYGEAAGQLGTIDVDVVVAAAADIRCYQGLTTTPVAATTPGDCTAKDANGNALVRPGDSIEVTAHYAFRPLTAQLIRILPTDYRLTKSARMVIQ
jgi:Flp pilus assembly protein TadG